MLAKSVLIFYLCKLYLLIIPNKQVLGKTEDDLIKKVLAAQPTLLPTKIARDGSIMEWVHEYLEFNFSDSCGRCYVLVCLILCTGMTEFLMG